MNIWIISLFDPTPIDKGRPFRYTSIALAGGKLDHHVTHFSCTFRHHTRKKRFEQTTLVKVNDNYDLVFIDTRSYKKNVSLKRLSSHRKYTRNLLRYIRKLSPPDAILMAMPPMSLSFRMSEWAKKNSIPFVIDIIDPWPDALLKLSPKLVRPLFKLLLYPMYIQLKKVLHRSAGIIGISNEYVTWAQRFVSQKVNSGVYWPAVPYKEIRDKISQGTEDTPGRDDKLKLIYAGNLGISYDIPLILEVAEVLEKKHPGKTEFLIAGTGYYQKMIQEYMEKYNNIKYLGFLNHDDLISHYANADLGLAQYPDGATQSVTYKLFDYLSAGLPILNSLMSEMAEITEHYEVGFNNSPGDKNKMVENIEKFLFDKSLLKKYKENALTLASTKGDSESVYKELIEFLTSLR